MLLIIGVISPTTLIKSQNTNRRTSLFVSTALMLFCVVHKTVSFFAGVRKNEFHQELPGKELSG